MARIGIITHNVGMIDLARTVSIETGHDLITRLGIPNDKAVEKALSFQNKHGVDAIIAHGAIYETIHAHVDVPVVRLDLTNFELSRVLHHAFKIGRKVAFVEIKRTKKTYDVDMVAKAFGYPVHRVSMNGPEDTLSVLDDLCRQKYEVVISAGHCIISQAPPELHTIELIIGRSELLDTINLAVQAIDSANKKKEKIRWMEAIVDNIEEGVFTCDRNDLIENFSPSAETITGIAANDVLGKNIKELLHHPVIGSLYGDGAAVTNQVVSLDIGKMVVTRIPIYFKLEKRGLVIKIQQVAKIQQLEQELRRDLSHKGFVAKATFDNISGAGKLIQEVKDIAKKYAVSSSNIIINGESGSGKELFAQSIHNHSTFRKGPFVAVNCAALSESLLESELFGYEEGAFTGARKGGKQGLFELAHEGTIFLDEIGDMPLSLQSRLLRVIQEKEVLRLGGSRVIPVKNRIICATNRDLAQDVEKGLFREDLYYRINILQLQLPALREHPEDIPVIAQAIFRKKCRKMKKNIEIRPTLLDMLTAYHWPGNNRELEAFVERLLSLSAEPEVKPGDFEVCFNQIRGKKSYHSRLGSHQPVNDLASGKIVVSLGTMDEMETAIIKDVLEYCQGDKDKAEKILGISKTTLWRKMKNIPFLNETKRNPHAVKH